MIDELFTTDAMASKSPMRQWMEKHGIVTERTGEVGTTQWFAYVHQRGSDHDTIGGIAFSGSTEEEACIALAKWLGIPTWKEVQL